MYRSDGNYIKVGKAAKLIGVTVQTLQNWDRKGILVAYRSETGRRYYTFDQLDDFFKKPSQN